MNRPQNENLIVGDDLTFEESHNGLRDNSKETKSRASMIFKKPRYDRDLQRKKGLRSIDSAINFL